MTTQDIENTKEGHSLQAVVGHRELEPSIERRESSGAERSGRSNAAPKHKIYCFNNGGSPGWYIAVAVADDGHCLAQHCCSHECFMRHDLGMDGTWKHENYNKHFGEGNWELEWVSDPKTHAGLTEAYRLNQMLAENSEAGGGGAEHGDGNGESESGAQVPNADISDRR